MSLSLQINPTNLQMVDIKWALKSVMNERLYGKETI
jgi:hypothetical protein